MMFRFLLAGVRFGGPLALLLLALAAPSGLVAQSGADVITGTVTGPAGERLANATVEVVEVESTVLRRTSTDGRGRYTVVFPDGSGRYAVRISHIGLGTESFLIERLADEDVLIADARLAVAPVMLPGIEVHGEAGMIPESERREAGGVEDSYTREELDRLPLDPGDFDAIAGLAPGVLPGDPDEDGILSGFSIGGLSPEANATTLDGATIDGTQGMPEEAIRATRVITNTYDVAQGQFSGGQIALRSRGGTNEPRGSFGYTIQDRALQWTSSEMATEGTSQYRSSAGFGGPVVRDRLLVFASASRTRRSNPLFSLGNLDEDVLSRLGADPDSVQRFFHLVESAYGVAGPLDPAVEARTTERLNFAGRMDWNPGERHAVVVQGSVFSQEADLRIGRLSTTGTGGEMERAGGGAILALTSRFPFGMINELRASLSTDRSDRQPYHHAPGGRVRVSSILEDGARSVANLNFGGSTGLPAWTDSRTLELANQSSFLLDGGRHRIKVGGLLHHTVSERTVGQNQYGTFVFSSLEDLEAGRPSLFTRTLSPGMRRSGGWNAALYLGDSWRPRPRLQVTGGLRMETSGADAVPAHNPTIEERFGVRNDRIPLDLVVSPRVGFSYVARGGGREGEPTVIRGGVGRFRARPPLGLYTLAFEQDGSGDGAVELYCPGEAAPRADWESYLRDPSTIPMTCAGDETAIREGRGRGVTVLGDGVGAMRSWRGSLGVQRPLLNVLQLSIDASLTEGAGLHGARDLNLDDTIGFTLPEEGDRPVFVEPGAVIARNGTVPVTASRVHPEFGHVFEVTGNRRSRTGQLTVSLRGTVPWVARPFAERSPEVMRALARSREGAMTGVTVRTSYTLSASADQGAAGSPRVAFSAPTPAGHPHEVAWGIGSRDIRHAFSAVVGSRLHPAVNVSLIARTSSGRPFTPMVGGDISGDGARNNPAFIFDPATVRDPEVAEGMRRVLQDAPARIRECLRTQMGTVAERNSCRMGWDTSLDLRTAVQPELPWLRRRVSLSMDAVNVLAGLDRALHGSSRMRGWGQRATAESVLLYPVDFDPDARAFRYEVNEIFGQSRRVRNLFGEPFQLRITGRITLGPERGARGGRGGGVSTRPEGQADHGPAVDRGDRDERLRQRPLVNPAGVVLALADSLDLGLTEAQRDALEQIREDLQETGSRMTEEVRAAFRGEQADRESMVARIREAREAAQGRAEASLERVREVLSEAQWEALPEEVRSAPARSNAPGGGRARPGARG